MDNRVYASLTVCILTQVLLCVYTQRVQTRVKLDDTYCRVALQISSNPNNEAKLVDLTIIMGIPEDVLGESLATQVSQTTSFFSSGSFSFLNTFTAAVIDTEYFSCGKQLSQGRGQHII